MEGIEIIERDTPTGWEPWNPLNNFDDKNRFRINGADYIPLNGLNHLNIFPKNRVRMFRFNGDFSRAPAAYQVYYDLRTRYGRFPRFRRFNFDEGEPLPSGGGKLINVKGRLTSATMDI